MTTKAIVMQKFRWKLFPRYYIVGNITIYINIAEMTGIQYTFILIHDNRNFGNMIKTR